MLKTLLNTLFLRSDITNLEHRKFIQNWQLSKKIEDSMNARKLVLSALKGIDRSNAEQPVGSNCAHSLELLQKDYKDFFQNIPFVRNEFNLLDPTGRLGRMRDNFDAQKDLDESSLEDIDYCVNQYIIYLIDLQEKFKQPNPSPEIQRAVDEVTRHSSSTPTADFIDNLPTEEPGAIADEDPF